MASVLWKRKATCKPVSGFLPFNYHKPGLLRKALTRDSELVIQGAFARSLNSWTIQALVLMCLVEQSLSVSVLPLVKAPFLVVKPPIRGATTCIFGGSPTHPSFNATENGSNLPLRSRGSHVRRSCASQWSSCFWSRRRWFFVVPMVSCLYPHFGSAKDESRVKIGGYISWGDIKKQWY